MARTNVDVRLCREPLGPNPFGHATCNLASGHAGFCAHDEGLQETWDLLRLVSDIKAHVVADTLVDGIKVMRVRDLITEYERIVHGQD